MPKAKPTTKITRRRTQLRYQLTVSISAEAMQMLDWTVVHGMAQDHSLAVDLCAILSQIILSDQSLSEQTLKVLEEIRSQNQNLPINQVIQRAHKKMQAAMKPPASPQT